MARVSFAVAMRKLCELSVDRSYDPFRDLEWPPTVSNDVPWMSLNLLTPHGTPLMGELSEEQLIRLSRCELVNFFSFNVHGIRELMLQVLACIHRSGHEDASEYFHHFLDEENKHMWFFAEFCKRYGGKIYYTQRMQFPTFADEDIQSFIAFSKILISEQISDFYNVRMMNDAALPDIVQRINRLHHEDETRHIAMGLRIVRRMHERIVERHPAAACRRVEKYLGRYMQFFIESFYNPSAYRDAGLTDPYEWRKRLLDSPVRKEFHARVLGKITRFFNDATTRTREVSR